MNKPAGIYARVSSDRQKENQTIASQTAALTEYAGPRRLHTNASALLRGQLEAQYAELAQSIEQHAFRDVVSKARNIVEGIIADKLGLRDGKDRLFTGLRTIEKLLNDPAARDTCGWTDMQYHLAHKIRILHGQTYATTRTTLVLLKTTRF